MQEESEEEEEEQQPGVLEGAVDTEASAAVEGGGKAGEAAAEQEPEAEVAAEGSGAEGAGDEDDDGFVKVRQSSLVGLPARSDSQKQRYFAVS